MRGFNHPLNPPPLQAVDLIVFGQRPPYDKVLVWLSSLCPYRGSP